MTDTDNTTPAQNSFTGDSPKDYIPALEALLEAAHQGEESAFNALLDDLTAAREQSLFQDVGKLTRQLHGALTGFQVDARLADAASGEFPEARDRLDQVIAITERSAHKIMDLVEDMMPRAEQLAEKAQAIGADMGSAHVDWDNLGPQLTTFTDDVGEQATAIRAGLSEVIISQNYQDLSGQEIRKVINLVTEVESTLINMIRVAGKSSMLADREAGQKAASIPEGEQRVTSQDEADELLSSLGF